MKKFSILVVLFLVGVFVTAISYVESFDKALVFLFPQRDGLVYVVVLAPHDAGLELASRTRVFDSRGDWFFDQGQIVEMAAMARFTPDYVERYETYWRLVCVFDRLDSWEAADNIPDSEVVEIGAASETGLTILPCR